MSNHTASAFRTALHGATDVASTRFVSLVRVDPYYGGPEEGGWWGEDETVAAFATYSTKSEAMDAARRVGEHAKELSAAKRAEWAQRMRNECDAMEARGEDPSEGREVDGFAKYLVKVSQRLPKNTEGSRRYE